MEHSFLVFKWLVLMLRSQFRDLLSLIPEIWVRVLPGAPEHPVFPLIALIQLEHNPLLECQLLKGSDSSAVFLVLFLLPTGPDTWQVLSKHLLTE